MRTRKYKAEINGHLVRIRDEADIKALNKRVHAHYEIIGIPDDVSDEEMLRLADRALLFMPSRPIPYDEILESVNAGKIIR